MNKGILQLILLVSLACLAAAGFVAGRYVLQLPFRASNDALHRDGGPLTLDFLIPGGSYVDEKSTIGEVIRMKLEQGGSPIDRFLRTISDQIPPPYRYLGNLLFFLFWTICFFGFFRIFTLMGYGMALRFSLLLGGIVYYFMPDLSPGWYDDALFVLVPILIILLRWYLVRKRRDKQKIFSKKSSALYGALTFYTTQELL